MLFIWRIYLTSAPSPSLKPSANLELVLWNTQALSTAARNLSAVSLSSVTMTSVCPDPYLGPGCQYASLCVTVSHLWMCSTALSMLGTISTVQLRSPYSLASFSALERVMWSVQDHMSHTWGARRSGGQTAEDQSRSQHWLSSGLCRSEVFEDRDIS